MAHMRFVQPEQMSLDELRRAVRELAARKIAEIESSDRKPAELVFLRHVLSCMDGGCAPRQGRGRSLQ